jgi:hypothetical protein
MELVCTRRQYCGTKLCRGTHRGNPGGRPGESRGYQLRTCRVVCVRPKSGPPLGTPCRNGCPQVRDSQDMGERTHFLRTSPYSAAPFMPTTRKESRFSSSAATTNGRLFLGLPDFSLSIRSRTASTSQTANRERVDGCAKTARSGPSLMMASRNVRRVLMACLSSIDVPWRMMDRCSAMLRWSALLACEQLSTRQLGWTVSGTTHSSPSAFQASQKFRTHHWSSGLTITASGSSITWSFSPSGCRTMPA